MGKTIRIEWVRPVHNQATSLRNAIMNDAFIIFIDNQPLEVRKLKFKNYLAAYEVLKNSAIQFILVHDANSNHAWNVDYAESSEVSTLYMDKVITAIDSHYA